MEYEAAVDPLCGGKHHNFFLAAETLLHSAFIS